MEGPQTPEVRSAQRHADYAYRLAVDPQPAKELRLFGLAGWVGRAVHLPPPPTVRVAIPGHPAAGAFGAAQPGDRPGRQRRRLRGAGARRHRRYGLAGPDRRVRPDRDRDQPDRLRRAELGPGRGGGAGRRGAPARRGDATARCAPGRHPARGRSAGAGDQVPRRLVPLSRDGPADLRPAQPDHPGRRLAGDRRPERGREDDAGQVALPAVRPATPASIEVDGVDLRELDRTPGGSGSPPCSRTSSASSCRSEKTSRRPARRTTRDPGRPGRCRRRRAGRARHDPGQGLSGRHRPVRRAVAAGRPGPGALRGPRRRRAGAAGRADRAAGCPRRVGDLRAGAGRDPVGHDDLDLTPVLHGPDGPDRSASWSRAG